MKQKIFNKEQHRISIDHIDPDALHVMKKLRDQGFLAYLVGGSVRDLLLGHTPKDFDISTSALPEQIKGIFKNCILIGKRFRLAHLRFRNNKVLEVSTFRSGNVESDSLIVRDNEWGSEEEDVIRRDFTINGLFYDSSNETIIDYVDGYADLKKHYLRTIGQPYLRFKQDPVRMIRLVKFQARFDFKIDKDTLLALLECRHELTKSSPARVLEELLRMLELGSSKVFFHLLLEHSLLQLMLPNLAAFLETDQSKTTFDFLDYIDDYQKREEGYLDRIILLSALIFPCFEHYLNASCQNQDHLPHLGQIHTIAYQFVHDMFSPFFPLPRRLKIGVVSLLTTQYRLVPLDTQKKKRLRGSNQPDFALAIEFLRIRSEINPALEEYAKMWSEFLHNPQKLASRPRRRKRKKPPST